MTRCLRLPVYRRLLAAYVLNELCWSVGTLALSVLVYRHTGSALGSAGFFLCSMVLPSFLSPALVARLDRAAPRRVIPALYALEAVLFAVLAWFSRHFSLAPVLLLSVIDGVVAATARSLASAARTEVLKPRDLLHEGNAVANFGFTAAYMAGPLIGGVVVAADGTLAALLVDCGLFAVMALMLALTRLPDARPEPGGALLRLLNGLRHAREDRLLFRLMTMQALGVVFFTISIPVEVVFAQHTLRAGPGGYGALMSVWGAGAIAGSAVYARFRRRSVSRLIVGSSLALGIGFAIIAVAPTLVVALVGAAAAGAGNGVESIAARTAVQERSPDRWMALMMSLADSTSQVAPGLGILLGGAIAAAAGARLAFAVAAAGSLAFAVSVPMVLRGADLAMRAGSRPAGAAME